MSQKLLFVTSWRSRFGTLVDSAMRRRPLVYLILGVATAVVYWQVGTFEFVNYDDTLYVTANPQVSKGITGEGVVWAFTDRNQSNWQPLAWVAHMVDIQLFGLQAGWHHRVSMILHIANVLLLLALLARATGDFGRSFFVAGLFALHPLHAESVAWIAERKDVLSTLFWLLSIWSYLRYVEKRSRSQYVLSLVSFALGLMVKAMLVTLPFCLLLLDYWPLRRAERGPSRQERKRKKASRPPVASTAWLIAEKIPFFALSAAVSVATFFFQKQAGAMDASEAVPVAARVANAFWAYAHYIAATFWPSGLAVLYPHQGADFPLWKGIASLALLGTISAAAVVFRRRAPYCSVGWFWFLGTLVPVIGFVQVGTQAYADRYTYVPHIGLFIAMVWGIPEFVGHRLPAGSFAPVAASILIILGIVTWAQLPHWKNSVSLFTRAVAVTENNYTAHGNLGNALADNRRLDEAVRHYREAVRIRPTYADAYNNWATISIGQGRLDDAASQLRAALRIKPAYAEAHSNMGMVLQAQGHSDEAISEFLEALRLKPDYFQAHNNAAAVLASLGRSEDAVMHYREALRLVPDYTKARSSLGLLFLQLGRLDEAETEFRELLARNPNHADGRATLERIITLKNAKQ